MNMNESLKRAIKQSEEGAESDSDMCESIKAIHGESACSAVAASLILNGTFEMAMLAIGLSNVPLEVKKTMAERFAETANIAINEILDRFPDELKIELGKLVQVGIDRRQKITMAIVKGE
jgi:hypothetical protein